MQTIKQMAKEQSFYDDISDHWQRRAKMLHARRWSELLAKEQEKRMLNQSKESHLTGRISND